MWCIVPAYLVVCPCVVDHELNVSGELLDLLVLLHLHLLLDLLHVHGLAYHLVVVRTGPATHSCKTPWSTLPGYRLHLFGDKIHNWKAQLTSETPQSPLRSIMAFQKVNFHKPIFVCYSHAQSIKGTWMFWVATHFLCFLEVHNNHNGDNRPIAGIHNKLHNTLSVSGLIIQQHINHLVNEHFVCFIVL